MTADEFRVPQKTFKRAAKKALELMSREEPSGILKRTIPTDSDLAGIGSALKRQIRH